MESSSAFRRTQSLRNHRGVCPVSSSAAANSHGSTSFNRGTRLTFRSKSSRNRYSLESQSLSARISFSQRMALSNSWRILKQQQIGPLIKKIFQDLENSSPKGKMVIFKMMTTIRNLVKEVFFKATYVDCFASGINGKAESPSPTLASSSNATLEEHIKLVTNLFDDLVATVETSVNIEGAEEVAARMIKTIGQQHAKLLYSCGFQADIWEQLGEIAMERICSTDPVQKTREAGRAWRTLIAYMTDKLRCGFEAEAKICARPKRSTERPPAELSNNNHCQENGHCQLIWQLSQLKTDRTETI